MVSLKSIKVAEVFAFLLLIAVLAFAAFDGLKLTNPMIQSIIGTCLFVLFGSRYMRMRGKKNE